jgi:hypothetical protein
MAFPKEVCACAHAGLNEARCRQVALLESAVCALGNVCYQSDENKVRGCGWVSLTPDRFARARGVSRAQRRLTGIGGARVVATALLDNINAGDLVLAWCGMARPPLGCARVLSVGRVAVARSAR